MNYKGFGNGRSILDNGYGMFLCLLDYKLSERNKYLIKVDKWFPSSQVCHEIHDRDINAAINILREGLRLFENAA